jgi:hypothetical protein
MVISSLVSGAIGACVGGIAIGFSPAIGRKIKSLFVKKTQAAEASVKSEVSSVASSVSSAVESSVKKV